MSRFIDYIAALVLAVFLFALFGCGDEKPRPIKSSKTCCQGK